MKSFDEIALKVQQGNIDKDEKFTIEAKTVAYINKVINRKNNEIQVLKFKIAQLELELIGSKATYEEVRYF